MHGLSLADLEAICRELDLPRFRAQQVRRWVFIQQVTDWDAMTNIPEPVREVLAERVDLSSLELVDTQGEAGDTRKLLLATRDGEKIETVMIPAADRRTVCVSSQVGCRYACAFCASGQNGLQRNLLAGEMVGQVVAAGRLWGERVTHVVFMGVGEPMDNLDEVLTAIRILNDAYGLGIGARRITVSTCGVVPGIRKLQEFGMQIELSVSLHAPDDQLRSRLMPVNQRYDLKALLEACREYTAVTRRIITFEYTLVQGLNDSDEQAHQLCELMAGLPCRANLIPLSPVQEFEGQPAPPERVKAFAAILEAAGFNVTVRFSQGRKIQAACGQLRAGSK